MREFLLTKREEKMELCQHWDQMETRFRRFVAAEDAEAAGVALQTSGVGLKTPVV